MALVTVQRSPSPSNSPETLSSDLGDGDEVDESGQRTPTRSRRSQSSKKRLKKIFSTIRFISRLRFSESYLAVKGAALILPQSECARTITRGATGEIQSHLQYMFYLLRPQDTIKVAVKLESPSEEWNRYLAIASTSGRQDTEESVILGVDITGETATIGMVLPIWGDMKIRLDGDGGFSVTTVDRHNIFKPVSVQAMWSALQTLIKVRDIAQQNSYHANGLTHTWVSYYDVRVKSEQTAINEWHVMEDIESHRSDHKESDQTSDKEHIEKLIKSKLKEIMMTVDLEEVTSKFLRIKVEEHLGRDLRDYKSFIDEEMIIILRQMDAPSEIFDFLYLGSEWNASNLEELRENGVGCILNVTREIDNFFPGIFEYCNVRLWDVEQSELLKYWDSTYKFIKAAKESHSKVLVHCKMGVSRSASTVIAFAMKEYGWSLEQAHKHVKSRRACIKPNSGFMKQLITYQGILDASKQRHNKLWRSVSTGNLEEGQVREVQEEVCEEVSELLRDTPGEGRPRSWSPEDSAAQLLMKAQDLGTESESSVEDGQVLSPALAPSPDKAPLSPFLFTIENWEELDISSRSADSLDDILDDIQAQRPHSRTGDSDNVKLLSYRPLPEDAPREEVSRGMECSGEAAGRDVLGSGSEVDDELDEDAVIRPGRGCYDMCMLTGQHTLLDTPEGSDEDGAGEEPPDGIYIWYLHPDTKLETIQSQFRKQRRIAQLLRLSERKEEEERVKIVQAEKSRQKKAKLSRNLSSPLLPTKVKPDDYWIKEASSSDDPGDEGIEISSPEGHVDRPVPVDIAVDDKEPESKPSDSGTSVSTDPGTQKSMDSPADLAESSHSFTEIKDSESNIIVAAGNQGQDLTSQSSSDTCTDLSQQCQDTRLEHTEEGRDGESSESLVSGECKEVGVWQHYEKEDIPWSPGTVKRQTLDLEEKIKSETSSEGTRRVSVSSDSSADCSGVEMTCRSTGDTQEVDKSPATTPTRPQSNPEKEVYVVGSVTQEENRSQLPLLDTSNNEPVNLKSHSTGQMSDYVSDMNDMVSGVADAASSGSDTTGAVTTSDFASPPRQSLSDGAVSPYRGGDREPNIYDTEEIPLEPGLVRRTKMEFEQRERSSSYAELEGIPSDLENRDGRPVQRSSSWKAEKVTKSKNRDSERRRTCLPVLQFSPLSSRESSVQRDAVDRREKEKAEPADAEEKITVVKVGSEDVEVNEGQVKRRTQDYEKLTVEEKQLLASLEQPARPRSRSHSPFVDECLSIPSGSVKQQKQQLETSGSSEDTEVFHKVDQTSSVQSPVKDVTTPTTARDLISDFENAHQKSTIFPSKEVVEEKAPEVVNLEGATTDSSTDEDKYEAIRTESMPTLLMEGVVEDGAALGIVKQHKQAIENKVRSSTPGKDEDEQPYKMDPELLTMIRRVGRTLVATPKETESETPTKRVKKVAQEIESKSGTDSGLKYYQNRMVIIEKDKSKVSKRLNLESPERGGSSNLGRSASLREKPVSPGVPASQVGRSSSLRESVSPDKKFFHESDVTPKKYAHVSSAAIVLRSPTSDKPEVNPSCAAAPEAEVLPQDEMQKADENDTKEPRKVVKDLVGIFETIPDEGSDPKDQASSPSKGNKTDSVKPHDKSASPEPKRKRSSSTTTSVSTPTPTSRVRTKSENFGAKSKTTTSVKAGAAKERTGKTTRSSTGDLSASGLKGSRELAPSGASARGKNRSPTPKRGEEGQKGKLSPGGPKREGSPRSVGAQAKDKKEDTRMKTSPSTGRVRTDVQKKGDESLKKSPAGRAAPRVDIKAASSLAAKETSRRSPKSSSPSPTPPGAGKSGKSSGGKSPVSRSLFPESGRGRLASDRKGSLPVSSAEKKIILEPARPRTKSDTSGTEQALETPQQSQGKTKDTVAATKKASSSSRRSISEETVISPLTGRPFMPLSQEMASEDLKPKTRRAHGKSHPLSKLTAKNTDSIHDQQSSS